MQVAIVGNGIAGTTTARFVGERVPDAKITIYSREPYAYYSRPRLIDFIAGEAPLEGMPQYDAAWYEKRHIETCLSCEVASIDTAGKTLTLSSGQQHSYDVLVLATGANAFVPPIAGVEKKGVGTLRTLQDAVTLCQAAQCCDRIVVLGGGLLGLDTAISFIHFGTAVTVVEAQPWLLPRQLDREGAAVLQHMVESRGVRVITDDLCLQVLGEEQVEGIRLKSGLELPACQLVISAGVRANIALAKQAGLACNRGILVNERMETSAPQVYAVGDCAEFNGNVWGIIPVALAQARVAASQIAGEVTTLYTDLVPSTTLQVGGIELTSIGEVNPVGEGFQEYRYADDAHAVYKKVVVRDGIVVGAIMFGDRSDLPAITRLVSQKIDVTAVASRLVSSDFNVGDWLKSATA
ncbi:MAG: NAD(P)/FAD-dependent oxidoreductase [Anaerolineae bacterium]|jgi:nitrite reductase (NADH) large subunit|nr:NAD(P)/FAD-dependent oxidoreductase [Chloroflexota bacterium]